VTRALWAQLGVRLLCLDLLFLLVRLLWETIKKSRILLKKLPQDQEATTSLITSLQQAEILYHLSPHLTQIQLRRHLQENLDHPRQRPRQPRQVLSPRNSSRNPFYFTISSHSVFPDHARHVENQCKGPLFVLWEPFFISTVSSAWFVYSFLTWFLFHSHRSIGLWRRRRIQILSDRRPRWKATTFM
jgi:hypothetical protein